VTETGDGTYFHNLLIDSYPLSRINQMSKSMLPKLAIQKLKSVLGAVPSTVIAVDVKKQNMKVIIDGKRPLEYKISTSKFGIGNVENSFQTPLGVHRIAEKYGDGAPARRIFKDRLDTGANWKPGLPPDDYVLTRILRLEGLEPGINKGPGIDSFERYIYIHGTSQEEKVGTPISHGCVVMKNSDVIDLYDRVKEGAIVLIS
jgi:lipoprotein-anchoring transpeptidase ErfK/SrfK